MSRSERVPWSQRPTRRERRAERRRRRLGLAVPLLVGVALIAAGVLLLRDRPTAERADTTERSPLTFAATTTSTTTPPVVVEAAAGSSGVPIAEIATTDALLANATPASVVAPVSIVIGRLGTVAPVDAVGIDPIGDVAVPADASRVGWYRHGATPGADGSSVLVGHVDFDGREGPFFRLAEAVPGDVVEVGYADGSTRRFTVTQRGQYRKDLLPTAELFRNDGPPQLVLITCGGRFRTAEHSYSDNVVVLATPV